MLTAEEARAQMPDKDIVVHKNVQSLFNEILHAARSGATQCTSFVAVYVEETLKELQKLGYSVRNNGQGIITVIWEEQQSD